MGKEQEAIGIMKSLGIYEALKRVIGKRELLTMFFEDFSGLVEIVLQAKEQDTI